jgi:hypothetical protein
LEAASPKTAQKGERTDLDVVVSAGGGEAAGGGMEVEAEHRLQVVPIDLHSPAPHPLLLRYLRLAFQSLSSRFLSLGFGLRASQTAGKWRRLRAQLSSSRPLNGPADHFFSALAMGLQPLLMGS